MSTDKIESMGRKRTDLKERVLSAAGRLFYQQGFPNTGISQIVSEANTNKASFYLYYNSKNDLGRDYITRSNRALIRQSVSIMRKSKNAKHFFFLWIGLLKRNVRNNSGFNGCPLANYYSQLENSRKEDREFVHRLMMRWISVLTCYFERERESGRLHKDLPTSALARMTYSIHQGAMISWKLTGNVKMVDDAYVTLCRMLNEKI